MTLDNDLLDPRRLRLERLRERFTAINLRSRTLRLNRLTRTGALDLSRLQTLEPGSLDTLLQALGHEDDITIDLIATKPIGDDARAFANDLSMLQQAARAKWLETGLQDLAVGWPLIEGTFPDGTWIRCPLLLFPAWLNTSDEGQRTWQLELQGLPNLNASLAQTMQRFAGITLDISTLTAFDDDSVFKPDDTTWGDLHRALSSVNLTLFSDDTHLPALDTFSALSDDAKENTSGFFRLSHHLILGRFPPSGSAVVGDYDALLQGHLDDARLGRAIELLNVDEDSVATAPQGSSQEDTTATAPLTGARQFLALASDSSQDTLLRWLDGEGSGVVVQGPPGTGKSQLITNVVTAALAQGSRVLVVCEKRAALDVVAERLGHAGLREPLAVVHDTSADRNIVCQGVCDALQRLQNSDTHSDDDPLTPALERGRERLNLTQGAFQALAIRSQGRPSLAELDERLLDDDQRPLPSMFDFAALREDRAHALMPRLDALSAETEALATPHPLAWRGDWREVDLEATQRRLQRVLDSLKKLSDIQGGHLTPAEALEHTTLWRRVKGVLGLFEEGDGQALHKFLLFWVWTGGQTITGAWREVMTRLEHAQSELRAVPCELILESESTVQAWIADLEQLQALGSRWFRYLTPAFWQLRKRPFDILDRCPSFYESHGRITAGNAAPVNVLRLCRDALGWQALIEALPDDNPFLDFGFQGMVSEIEDAIHSLQEHHDHVHALHHLHETLHDTGESYQSLPDFEAVDTPQDAHLIRAALADAARAAAMQELEECVEQVRHKLDGALPDKLDALLKAAGAGDFVGARADLDALLEAWDDAPRAVAIDRLLVDEPDWLKHFLRHWRRHAAHPVPARDDAQRAVGRAWREGILAHRGRRSLEAPLVDAALLDALSDDLAACEGAAARGVLARYHARLSTRWHDKEGGKALRQLMHQARKRRYRLTLRQLIERFWTRGLADVCPIWLCSPDAVAAMFPLEAGLFDVAIFDEASQCTVESAVPVAARAHRLVIAGDDQQMPPSQFFQTRRGVDVDTGDSALLSSQSVLELAQVAFPRTTLRWHYRSHHEALVAFSNQAFYAGQLITAPRPERPKTALLEALHWKRVDGLWQEQRNLTEANAVVALIKELLAEKTAWGGPPSLGIVTFNLNQAGLIQQRIDAAMYDDDAFREAIRRDQQRPPIEQLFVRNLENVQGDERDVIIFSTGYGPTEPGGKVAARFGPLGQIGGEKRLNVAITRAKLGVWVVCSFDPDQLDVKHTRRVGPKLFKRYLQYVKAHREGDQATVTHLLQEAAALGGVSDRHMGATLEGARTQLGSRTMHALAEALQSRGLVVAKNYGIGHARVDIAVGQTEGDWRLGIDCTRFLSEAEALTRDVYTHAYWRRLGWDMVRVTPGMWREDGAALIDQLVARVTDDAARR